MKRIEIDSLSELERVAEEILSLIGERRVVLLRGGMGAGKTTLVSRIASKLGAEDTVTSPTFALVNQYEGREGTIYHFDFYRINRPEEALDFGLYDYFDSGNPCLMEWPECIEPLLPDDTIKIHISVIDDNTRQIKMDD